jgi:hypothetical protein
MSAAEDHFGTWRGLLTERPFYGSLEQSLVASAVHTIVCLTVAYAGSREQLQDHGSHADPCTAHSARVISRCSRMGL